MASELREYRVWDRTTRAFHWINVLCVLALIAAGLGILNSKAIGLSIEGKAQLKVVHVLIGYVLVINLAWRLVWAFVGNTHARWRALLPMGRGQFSHLRGYLRALAAGREPNYVGHNPLARWAITILLSLLITQSATGLVLAGTDLFYPPFGGYFARQVAADGVDPDSLGPNTVVTAKTPEKLDAQQLAQMRAFKEPFEEIHKLVFYALLGMIALHLIGVITTEVRGGGTLISAMFTGRKVMRESPVDVTEEAR